MKYTLTILILLSFHTLLLSQNIKQDTSINKTYESDTIILTDDDEQIEEEKIFVIVENMPEFPGGDLELRKYVSKNVKYPELAKELGIEGKVYVRFVVTEKGTVERVQIARGVQTLIDKEAIKVVESMPKWMPGPANRKKVKVWYTLPLSFELDSNFFTKHLDSSSISKIEKTPNKLWGKYFNYEKLQAYQNQALLLNTEIEPDGKVFLYFKVIDDNTLEHIEILKSTNSKYNKLAVEIVQNLDWKVMKKDDKPVAYPHVMILRFKDKPLNE